MQSMKEKELQRAIKNLAKAECANYQNKLCLLTDEPCHIINPDYDSVHDGAIDCDWFLEAVLPADWDLNDLIWYAIWYDEEEPDEVPEGMKICEVCKRPFLPTHHKQKYCKGCAESVNRKKTRERMYNNRNLQ